MTQRRIAAIVFSQVILTSLLISDALAQSTRSSSTRGRTSYRSSGTSGGRGGFYGFNSHEEAARRALLEQRAAEEAYQEALRKRELIKEGKLDGEEVETTAGSSTATADTPCDRGDRECINHERRRRWEEKRRLRVEARDARSAGRRNVREERPGRSEGSKRRIPEEDLSRQVDPESKSGKLEKSAKSEKSKRERISGESAAEANDTTSLREQIDAKLGKKKAEETLNEQAPAVAK